MDKINIFARMLAKLRSDKKLTQEALAEMLGVSKQAVQKWETGKCFPSLDSLLTIAKVLDISTDYLLSGTDKRSVEELRTSSLPLPSYENPVKWEAYYEELDTEYRQSFDEGKDIEKYRTLITEISRIDASEIKEKLADTLFSLIEGLPVRDGYKYYEPSDYPSIVSASAPKDVGKIPSKKIMQDKVRGAWYGRICGCLLGKPVECMRRHELVPFLTHTGNYPMHRYITKSDAEKAKDLSLSFPISDRAYPDGIMDGMPVDDDTNYIMIAREVIKKYGRDFTPNDVADTWLCSQPKTAYCTAERVAFCNFVRGYTPPQSARYKNPYREWIGAQIRGDFFGWINPGDPATAAEYAYRDASISHIKNGIYGEMWVAAMLAAAAVENDIKKIIRTGISYIPKTSRLFEAVENIITSFEKGVSEKEFFDGFHSRYDDTDGYDWCHTVSNAEIVAASLLYGGGDYGKSICIAVENGFDTDCNGATVGSVMGMLGGFSSIPKYWSEKISGTLFTSIIDLNKVDIDTMANETLTYIYSK